MKLDNQIPVSTTLPKIRIGGVVCATRPWLRVGEAARIVNIGIAAVAAAAALLASADASASQPTDCELRLISAATSFPERAPGARRGGTVLVHVTIAPDGSVTSAGVRHTSGHRALDEAAVQSALTRWKFAPTSCDGARTKDVAVEFQPSPAITLSMIKAPGHRNRLAAAMQGSCELVSSDAAESIVACIGQTEGTHRRHIARR